MRVLTLSLCAAMLALLPACVDVPQTSDRIDQDVRGATWMRSQTAPVSPGILSPQSLGDQTQITP